jgi:hypothetical protein
VALERIIAPRRRSLGVPGAGEVDRLLPHRERRMVGPFIFADLIGPDALGPGAGSDIPPHPHIGLATVTYLFAGSLVHRDSTGAVQQIEPGEVNWMTAGRGVAHSERSPAETRRVTRSLAGLQTWVALPDDREDVDPSFVHARAIELPTMDDGVTVRLIAGAAFGHTAPVPTASPLFHAEVLLAAGSRVRLPPEHSERAVLVVDGAVEVDDQGVAPHHLAVAAPGDSIVTATTDAHVVSFGGAPVGPRYIWWNFVSSSRGRIDEAAADWAAGRVPAIPGETERVELPRR